MKIRNTITKLITMTIALAAVVGIGFTAPAEAQHVRVFDGMTFAHIIPAHTLRFSIMNLTTPEEGGEAIRARVLLYDENCNLIARSQDVEVSAGGFRGIDFKYEDLSLEGDPETGRVELRATIQVLLSDASVRNTPPDVSVYAMVIDPRTGNTVIFSSFRVGVRVGATDR